MEWCRVILLNSEVWDSLTPVINVYMTIHILFCWEKGDRMDKIIFRKIIQRDKYNKYFLLCEILLLLYKLIQRLGTYSKNNYINCFY